MFPAQIRLNIFLYIKGQVVVIACQEEVVIIAIELCTFN